MNLGCTLYLVHNKQIWNEHIGSVIWEGVHEQVCSSSMPYVPSKHWGLGSNVHQLKEASVTWKML